MEKWQPLNMELRSWAIGLVLRLEQTLSSALRTIFRMFKPESKTLGNQSSALTFKSKVDLLFDLEEIDKTEYSHLLKLMEVRNQFAHNSKATSFTELDKINPDINKYLLRYCPKELENEKDHELKLKSIFGELFKQTAGKLISIDVDYTDGIQEEMRKHINHKIVENLEDIWKNALKKKKEKISDIPNLFLLNSNNDDIENFYADFRVSVSEYALKELEELEGKEGSIFKRKVTGEQQIGERMKKEENKEKTESSKE